MDDPLGGILKRYNYMGFAQVVSSTYTFSISSNHLTLFL